LAKRELTQRIERLSIYKPSVFIVRPSIAYIRKATFVMSVRRLSRRKAGLNGLFPALKLGRMAWYESYLERDCFFLLDYDPAVETFSEQPLTLTYADGDKTRHYTPDIGVRTHDHQELLIECKPLARVKSADNQRKLTAAQSWCRDHGWSFCVATEAELRQGPYLNNVKLLTRYARVSVPLQVVQRVESALCSATPWTVGRLAEHIAPDPPDRGVSLVLKLAFEHRVWIDLNRAPLSLATPVEPSPLDPKGGMSWLSTTLLPGSSSNGRPSFMK
jgi:hypothetical protein